MSGAFGFKTTIVDCASAAEGKYSASAGATELGTMYGQCQAIGKYVH
jgi:hypothetical protein